MLQPRSINAKKDFNGSKIKRTHQILLLYCAHSLLLLTELILL